MGDRRRTKTEQQANDFDLKLFNLMREAERLCSQSQLGNKWRATAAALAAVRPPVRTMMHPDDRKETT
jgi:hypothetical protein